MVAHLNKILNGGRSDIFPSRRNQNNVHSSRFQQIEKPERVRENWRIRLAHPRLQIRQVQFLAPVSHTPIQINTDPFEIGLKINIQTVFQEKWKLPILVFLVIRHGGDEGVVDVEDPSIGAVAFEGAGFGEVHDALFDGPLGIDSVLSGGDVFADVAHAFLGNHLEVLDVVELDVQSPALAVVF